MKIFARFLYIFISSLALYACSSSAKIKDGTTAYNLKKYTLADDMLEKDFNNTKDVADKSKIAYRIAKSYDNQLKFSEAEEWYKKIYDMRVLDNSVMLYINALKRNEKYEQAYTTLNDYLNANKTEKFRLGNELDFLEETVKQLKKPNYVTLKNLDINTPSIDFSPFIKGNTLYFSSTQNNKNNTKDEWTGEGFSDIYTAQKVGETNFQNAQPLDGKINTPFHESSFVLSKDGKTAFFTRCGTGEKNKDQYCHIYRVTKNIDDTWSEPERMKFFADTVNEGHPYLTPDESELYFSADYLGGYGGKDIYSAKKNIAGDFENPVNAGSKVNGTGDELFPTFDEKGTLYFSSTNKPNLYGGLDIYSATKEGKLYTNIKNLGWGLNSGADEMSFIPQKSKDDSVLISGYLVSNRKGGKGLDDIYYVEKRMAPKEKLPPPVYVLRGTVQENSYEFENNPNSKVLGVKPIENAIVKLPENIKTNTEGKFEYWMKQKQNFTYEEGKEGYLSRDVQVNMDNIQANDGDTIVINQTILLSKIYKNVEIVLNNIYYDYDKWNIRKDAAQSLDTLVEILQKNPTIKIELASHTDCRGSDTYNQTLSQKRAESVVAYLIEKEIDKNRLTARGYGESVPVEKCECTKCTEEQHQRNRRTTFKILSE